MAMTHSNCDHPATSGERAKCRRRSGKAEGKAGGATPREVDLSKVEDREEKPKRRPRSGGTPRDAWRACQRCGLEVLKWRGTDPLTGMLIHVGEDCAYVLEHADDRVEVARP